MINKLRSLFYQLAGIDQFDNDFSKLSNIKPITSSEKLARQIIKQHPHLKPSDIIHDAEEGWVRVVR